jgi:hypothetical protein
MVFSIRVVDVATLDGKVYASARDKANSGKVGKAARRIHFVRDQP